MQLSVCPVFVSRITQKCIQLFIFSRRYVPFYEKGCFANVSGATRNLLLLELGYFLICVFWHIFFDVGRAMVVFAKIAIFGLAWNSRIIITRGMPLYKHIN